MANVQKNIKFDWANYQLKPNYQNYMILFTVLLLWVSNQFGQIVGDSIAYIIILSIGVFHGSNDFTILKKQQTNPTDLIKLTSIYIFLILFCVGCYLINPFMAILFFIGLSSYHFGEQHLESKLWASKGIKILVYLIYGMLIFSLIFTENQAEVDKIMINLTGKIISETWFRGMLIFSSLAVGLLWLLQFFLKQISKTMVITELFYVLLLYIVFKVSSLILGFAVYFVLWHSIPSIINQTKFLSGNCTKKTLLKYIKTALGYWIASLVGLFIAYCYLDESLFNATIFIVLFALTTPHVWVMNRIR